MTDSFLYLCDLEVPLKGAAVDLLKRLAVLLRGSSLSCCSIEETFNSSSKVGVVPTSDARRFPMKGMMGEKDLRAAVAVSENYDRKEE
jgi:hypothetical protein